MAVETKPGETLDLEDADTTEIQERIQSKVIEVSIRPIMMTKFVIFFMIPDFDPCLSSHSHIS